MVQFVQVVGNRSITAFQFGRVLVNAQGHGTFELSFQDVGISGNAPQILKFKRSQFHCNCYIFVPFPSCYHYRQCFCRCILPYSSRSVGFDLFYVLWDGRSEVSLRSLRFKPLSGYNCYDLFVLSLDTINKDFTGLPLFCIKNTK